MRRRLVTWLGLGAGALVVLRRFRRRPAPEAPADPAEELKQRLADSRAEEPAAASEPAAEPAAPVDARRRAVHDKARRAIDDMLGGEDLPGEEAD